jgi:ABC-type dipeptide/oligopeptide/nickel transport system ATPase component
MSAMAEPLLQIEDLRTYIYLDEGVVHAVDGVSFSVERGQTVALVGESGSGKSVVAQSIMRILPTTPGLKAAASCSPGRRFPDLASCHRMERPCARSRTPSA